MVKFAPIVLLSLIAATASGAPIPLRKRIQQTIANSLAAWEQACDAAANKAGGALEPKCNPLKIDSFDTLLAAAGPCDQQKQGDLMIDLAKQLNSDPDMIRLTQIFVQQPRNSPNSIGVPYCDTAPRNSELNGYFQCQFQGSNLTTFSNGQAAGGPGTLPFGHTKLDPPGSCPANPSGPIADGTQLIDITQNPGPPSTGSTTPGSLIATSPSPASNSTSDASSSSGSSDDSSSSSDSSDDASSSSGSSDDSSSSSDSSDFHLSNGKKAQAQNAAFASLTPDSSCTAGPNACVQGNFGQCVGNKYVTTPCGATTKCFALPLVNSAGSSVTCTTPDDAKARIAATGATGGITGSGN
ncbi:hypothetical protein AX14_010958 [Amanita brunnescens Koide BX004]|nr:hypothetical protein AX14_010958 [Amanita brunnescens Koide BX004]